MSVAGKLGQKVVARLTLPADVEFAEFKNVRAAFVAQRKLICGRKGAVSAIARGYENWSMSSRMPMISARDAKKRKWRRE